MYADILVEIGAKAVDKIFNYLIPSSLKENIQVGVRVKVPFGNRIIEGFVLKIHQNLETSIELKEIISVIDEEPILNEEMLYLGQVIAKKTLCSLISAYQVMLPKALKASINSNINKKYHRFLVLNKPENIIINYLEKCPYEKQKEILNQVLNKKKLLFTALNPSIKTLVKKEYLKIIEEEAYRYQYNDNSTYKKIVLSEEQNNVINSIKFNEEKTYLLHGITGSGKTEVYINLIEKSLKLNQTAIMLVPEISLTPQIVSRFKNRFHDDVAVLHSGLSDQERYDEYRKIKNKKVHIVVGARSAIFAPLNNIGIIIIDEEHVSTYKQDNNPKYHAIDIAKIRSKYHHCPVILGSATPSLESYARAQKNVYTLLTMKKRSSGGVLPTVSIVDMKKEYAKKNYILSQALQDKITEKLSKNEQIILLLNRRGYSTLITCPSCGYTYKCPNCDISLTYHKTTNTLRCHYCGYGTILKDKCPNCQSDTKDLGLGTEKLEEYLNTEYPHARVIRMDLDTTTKKNSHEKIIDNFSKHQYDILVGTQMIAKGLDFPEVTLVGVINADSALNIPDFRSSERTFQLLCQVSGRAGRSDKSGEVIIQTFNNDHYSILLSKTHDYESFYQTEMDIRRKLKYSPYYFITLIQISSKNSDKAYQEAKKIGEYLRNNLTNETIILGPTTCNIFKINNVFHYQIIIKYRRDPKLENILINIDNKYKIDSSVNVEINVNPSKL